MPLDMFQQTQSDTNAYVARSNAPRLPASFGDTFSAAWDESRMFGQSIAGGNARASAVNDYADELYQKTGDAAFHPAVVDGNLDQLNEQIRATAKRQPDLGLQELTPDALDQRAIAKSKAARTDFEDTAAREKTMGGSIGMFLGGTAGALTDPVNLVALPLAAPEGLGILKSALAWAGIAGGSQAAIEALGTPYRDQVVPGYGASGEPARNILEAALFGGVTGGGLKALGNAWTRLKTGEWPRTIRDAGNVTESEANIAQTNVLPGVAGEAAHREALSKTIDDLVAGRRVDVPEAITAPRPREAITLQREADTQFPVPATSSFTTGHRYGMVDDVGRRIGVLDVEPRDDGKSLEVVWIGHDEQTEGKIDLGPTALRGVLRQIRDLYPEAERLTGERISGARTGQFNPTGQTSAPQVDIRLPPRREAGGAPAPTSLFSAHEATVDGLMEGRAETPAGVHVDTLTSSITDMARMVGYDMPREEAAAIADQVAKAKTDEQARAILNEVAARPRTVNEFPPAVDAPEKVSRETPLSEGAAAELTPKSMRETLGSPELADAAIADLDRLRMTTDRQVPAGIDEKGEPVYRSLDSIMDELKADRDAADQLAACANPPPEPVE